jgi:uncharacterized membrane protein
MKGRLWWWAALLGCFVLLAQFTSAGMAWSVVEYAGLTVVGLTLLLLLIAGFIETRGRRGDDSPVSLRRVRRKVPRRRRK